jgi:hypothetical protein
MKICKACDLTKEISEFAKKPDNKDGLSSNCRDCVNLRQRQRYEKAVMPLTSLKKQQKQIIREQVRATGLKTCNGCKIIKDKSMFYKSRSSPDGVIARCKDCTIILENTPERKALRLSYRNDPEIAERRRAYNREYNKKPEAKAYDKAYQKSYARRVYLCSRNRIISQRNRLWISQGIKNVDGTQFSFIDYEILLLRFDGVCGSCGTDGTVRHRPLCVDHDHETGVVRGILCKKCNAAFGILGDSPAMVQGLSNYARMYARNHGISVDQQETVL